jgi:hypothetical protein
MGPTSGIRISTNQGEKNEENWYVTSSGTYLSAQETRDLFESDHSRLAGLPFDNSYVTFGNDSGTLTGQLALVNASTAFAYDFTSLRIYKNLDLAFFNNAQFDSAAAIASGSLAIDGLSLLGALQIPLAGLELLPEPDQTFPFLVFPLGTVTPGTYVLALGSARPIFADGNFGAATPFSIGIQVTPEPSFFAPVGAIAVLLSFVCRRRTAIRPPRALPS